MPYNIIPGKISPNTSPLCFTQDGRLVCYNYGHILVVYNEEKISFFSIPISYKEKWFGRFRMTNRLLRLGIRQAIAIDNKHILCSQGNIIQELNIDTGEVSHGWYCGDGIRPLKFTDVRDIPDIDDGIYFGGYLGNMEKNPVSLYHRTGVDQWEVVYTFPQNTINHVHNIVADPYRKCLWVYTGDFEEASAIWQVTNNFKKVERVACNSQKYRGCIVYALPEGLLYATDAPFVDNYICLLNPDTMQVKELFPIHGSCIYGCKWKDMFVFSSTVEGDGRNTPKMEFYFGRKRGAGIKDDYVHMYMGNLFEGFKEIYKEKKDCMPFYTFQFGVFKFPAGENNSDIMYFQPVATKKHDLELVSLNLNNL